MNGYVLKKTDGPGYVAINGNKSSYTNSTRLMKIYETREAAIKDSCIENEKPVAISNLFTR